MIINQYSFFCRGSDSDSESDSDSNFSGCTDFFARFFDPVKKWGLRPKNAVKEFFDPVKKWGLRHKTVLKHAGKMATLIGFNIALCAWDNGTDIWAAVGHYK